MTGAVPELDKLRHRGSIHRAAKTLTRMRGRLSAKVGMPDLAVRTGVVTAAAGGTYTATVGGVSIPGMVSVGAYAPAIGDTVTVLCSGTDWMILGGADLDGARGELGYAQRVSPDSVVVSGEAILNPPAVTVHLDETRKVRVSFAGLHQGSTAATVSQVTLYRAAGTAVPDLSALKVTLVRGAGTNVTLAGVARQTLNAGDWTYACSHTALTGGATTQMICGAAYPATLLVEDMGPG